jgi:chromosomal replication initiator protein
MNKTQEFTAIDLNRVSLRRGVQQIIPPPALLLPQFFLGPENQALEELFSGLSIAGLSSLSPVVLFGPNAAGKTTLAHELLWRWSRDGNQRKLTLTSGTEFGRALQRGIKADDMARFRLIHRQCDGLLIDNLHELATKPAAQAELIAILKDAEEASRLVVVTCPELPRLRSGLQPGLQSLLAAGLSVPVQMPGPAARRAIAGNLLAEIAPEISQEDIRKFCSRIQDQPTAVQLKGLLHRWVVQLQADSLAKLPLLKNASQKTATPRQSALKQIEKIVSAGASKVTSKELLKLVAKEFQLSLDALTGPSRKSGVVRARGLAMLMMRQLTNESFEAIGNHFSGRDHTTVMHSCKKTEGDLAIDSELSRIYDRIKQRYPSNTSR